ncbi:Pimeloyl-ACP methyl ester carboxylesterase [Amycolatopsis xylanica]|uniref:Pimeloyl-ACP methyl ester carboxylesterase n=1 Tax=Amycolatopsis xylanica TaxID=589385 RepID=A0A1H3SQU7_9PSEU|nr:alpha/beta fold hydrolase [Amycolatopsis xylanica]SDZ40376.1 Pimeloyl-ACP methyl ester carboxylesterase [Amycolatopsis xylanica]
MTALPTETAVPPRNRFITSDGVALRVVESGPAAPVTVVLAHCWTCDHTSWDDVVAKLGPEVRVLRYDHRGHGRSGVGEPSIARLGDDLAELIEQRVAGKVVLAGHSLGGMTIMALGERHPELVRRRVAGAVFVATSAGPFRMKPWLLKVEQIAGLRTARRDPRARALPSLLLRPLLFGARPQRTSVVETARQMARAHPASMAGFRGSILRHDRTKALSAFRKIPTAVLVGDADKLTPPTTARAIARALPAAEFTVFPRAGHMLPYERSAEVAARIWRIAHA